MPELISGYGRVLQVALLLRACSASSWPGGYVTDEGRDRWPEHFKLSVVSPRLGSIVVPGLIKDSIEFRPSPRPREAQASLL
jgi:hypothetical protein